MNHTVWPFAVPLYKGRRTVSLVRSTWSALSRTKFWRGSSPVSWPRPFADPVLAGIVAVVAGASRATTISGTATAATASTASHRNLKKLRLNLVFSSSSSILDLRIRVCRDTGTVPPPSDPLHI